MKHARLRTADTSPLNLAFAVDLWLQHLEARGCSANTLTVYRYILSTFIEIVGNLPLTDVTPDLVRAYLVARRRQGKSPQTVAGNFRTLSTFFAWCVQQSLSDANPCQSVDAPKREKVLKRALSVEEAERLLTACAGTDFVRVRDRALLLVLLDAGIRISECHQLRVGDVAQEGGIIIRGKGGRYRYVFLTHETRLALLRYVRLLGNLPADAPLWWSRGRGKPLALEGLKQAVENIGRRAGVKVSPHVLRRTFAVFSLRHGMDLHRLQILMGHADIQTTQVYLSLVEDDLKQAHEQHSPLRMLRKK